MKKPLKFKVNSLRTLVSPYKKGAKDESTYETIYYLLVDMKDLPENIPLDVNPREPKMTTNVAKSLLAAVTEPETDFYINNRGIVIPNHLLLTAQIQRLQSTSVIKTMKMIGLRMEFWTEVIPILQS